MWIETLNGDAINLQFASKIELMTINDEMGKVCGGGAELINDPTSFETIATFDNEENAKACIEEIINALNGEEKVGYAFSWLNKEVF